jgi:hypothetical protein
MERVTRDKIAKWSGLTLFLGAIVLVAGIGVGYLTRQAAAQNLPTQIEALRGRVWIGGECCGWKFTWQHKSGPFFRGNGGIPTASD